MAEQFCDSPFWDANLTWNNSWPEFTECFQNTALTGGPCLLLWLASSVHAYCFSKRPDDELQKSGLYKKRMFFSYILAFVTLLDLSLRVLENGMMTELPPLRADILAKVVLFSTVLLNTAMVRLERQKGVLTSVPLFWFWFCLMVTQVVHFYSIVIRQDYVTRPVECGLFYVKFVLIIVQFVLHSFAEKPKPETLKALTRPNHEIGTSVLTKITQSFMGKFLQQCYEGDVGEKDLSDLWDSEKSANVFPRFSLNWQKDVARAREKNRVYAEQFPDEFPPPKAFVRTNSTNEEHQKEENGVVEERGAKMERSRSVEEKGKKLDQNGATEDKRKHSPKKEAKDGSKGGEVEEKSKPQPKFTPSLFWALVKTYWLDFMLVQTARAIHLACTFTRPMLFGLLLDFMDDSHAPLWRGFFLCGLTYVASMTEQFMNYAVHYNNHCLALRLKHAASSSIFKKALTMDTESRQDSTVGQGVNLMSDDVNQIVHMFCWMLHEMWTAPVKIVVCFVMLYNVLGSSMLVGVLLLVILVPVNLLLVRKMTKMHKERMDQKDGRLKSLTEVINGIKILKMYAWEPSFFDKVNDVRSKELDNSWRATAYETIMHCYWFVTPYAVSVVVFVSYIYTSDNHYLAPSVAFMALSLIDMLRHTMGLLPHIINCCVKSAVSFKRVNEFLFRTDLDDDVVRDSNSGDAISIKEGYFTWGSDLSSTLKNINVRVKKGSLVAVVGTVGSGKSSLVSACLGEMKRLHGEVSVMGSVAYVAQQAWIQHATLRDNLLFGSAMDHERYDACLDACSLRQDLNILPGGDMTEIGEKGINLSGGQKQRVSLARAVYSNADVYLLDDPLSAVDCHVGSHIFNKVIGHQGMLAGKTRVLVTHGVQWLPVVDQVIVIKHGRVSEVGTYEELLSHNGAFAKFLKNHFAHQHQDDADPEVRKMKFRILSRLDSIPKENNDKNNKEGTESDESSETESKKGDFSKADDKTDEEKDRKSDKSKLVEDENDEIQTANVRSTLKEMAKTFGYRWVLLYFVLFLAQQISEHLGGISLSQWSDDPQLANLTSLPPNSTERLDLNNHYLTLYTGFGVLYAVTTLFGRLAMLMRMVVAARKQHSQLLGRVLKAPMSFFDTTPVGRIVNRFSSHLNTVDQDLPHTVAYALYCTVGLLGKIILVCYTMPVFFIFLLPICFVYIHLQKYFYPTMRQLERLSSKSRSPMYSFFSETLGGTTTIRAFGAQDRFLREFQRKVDLLEMVHWNWGNCNRWLGMRLTMLGMLTSFGVCVTAVILRDSMSAGLVGLSVTVAMDVTGTLHDMIHVLSWLQTRLPSVDRIKEYSEMAIEADWRKEETKPAPSWPQHGEVKVDDLAVRYREGMDLVLKGININIGAGEKVGIVGRTGAGKSSLTLALFRLIEPSRGHVTVDDVNISELGLHDLRSRLTILPQDPVIFAGTLRMNLDPFSRHTDEQVWEALRHAHLSDFVQGLKEGLLHDCGEGGENLSVGQRQLLCLARTLLHKTRVLVLDEATAAVDMETDELIQKTIRSEFSECTVLTIAHRLNTVIDYDKILVLDKGEKVEFDTPVRLMQDTQSVFHGMAKSAGILPLIAKRQFPDPSLEDP